MRELGELLSDNRKIILLLDFNGREPIHHFSGSLQNKCRNSERCKYVSF